MSMFAVDKYKASGKKPAARKRRKRRKKEVDPDDKGILYVLVFDLDGEPVYKIGITRRNHIEDRVLEILEAFFKKYRYFPKCTPKRFSKIPQVLVAEQEMHKHFEGYSHKFDKKFGGSSEFFSGVELDSILTKYDEIKNRKGLDV